MHVYAAVCIYGTQIVKVAVALVDQIFRGDNDNLKTNLLHKKRPILAASSVKHPPETLFEFLFAFLCCDRSPLFNGPAHH